jgi:DnaJ family protein A protein 5
MQNHVKSKKHKEAFKRYQAKLKKQEEERLAPKMDEKDEAEIVEPPVEKKRERKKKRWQKVEEEEKDKAEVMDPPVEKAVSDAKEAETDDSGEPVMEGEPVEENKEPTDDTTATEQDPKDFEVDPAKGALDDVLRADDGDDDDEYTESEEEPEPDVWWCECCRKEFRSEAQMENHMKSKKHKEASKKYKLKEELMMAEMMDDMDLES